MFHTKNGIKIIKNDYKNDKNTELKVVYDRKFKER